MVVCKLCVNILDDYSNEFEVLGEIVREMLDVVLLNSGLGENEKSVICKTCKENLHKSFEFKATCIDTEDCLYPYLNSSDGEEIDLRVVYSRERTTDKTFKCDKNVEVCRFCLSLMKSNIATELKAEILKYDEFFGDFMPELNLGATSKAVVCEQCHISLEKYVKFVKFCSDNESRVMEVGQKCTDQNNERSKTNLARLRSNLLKSCKKEFENVPVLNSSSLKNEEDIDIDENPSTYMEETSETKSDRDDYSLPISELGNSDDFIKIEELEIKSDMGNGSGTSDGGIDQKKTILQNVCEDMEKFCQKKASANGISVAMKDEEIFEVNTIICKYPDQQNTGSLIRKDEPANEMFKCEICCYETKYKYYLKTHMIIHKAASDMRIYKCEICSHETNWKRGLKTHMLLHKDTLDIKVFKCGICKYETKQKRFLKSHMIIHHNVSDIKMLKCEFCDYEAKLKCRLSAHMKVHKRTSDVRMYKCEICSLETKWKQSLKTHMLIHQNLSDIKMFKCGICIYEGKQKGDLKRHMLIHKNVSDIKMLKCEICTYETKQKSHLKMHKLIHKKASEINMFKCEICNYKAKLKCHISAHMKIHKSTSDIRMYKCVICSHETKWKQALKTHMLIHKDSSDIKMFKCQICNFETKHKGHLITHMLIHKETWNIKMYKCEVCSHETKWKSGLLRHMLTHKDALDTFKRGICNHKKKQKHHLKTHTN